LHWGKKLLMAMDASMPFMSGITTSLTIKSGLNCEARWTASLLQQSRNSGHNFELLAKPIPPADLIAKLRDYAG
jgi:CheY-like chemotaxis protein